MEPFFIWWAMVEWGEGSCFSLQQLSLICISFDPKFSLFSGVTYLLAATPFFVSPFLQLFLS